jgi:hypothetical protein
VQDGGGKVFGVIPAALMPREVSGAMLGDTVVVGTMHERKALMAEKAHFFIALPGGFGYGPCRRCCCCCCCCLVGGAPPPIIAAASANTCQLTWCGAAGVGINWALVLLLLLLQHVRGAVRDHHVGAAGHPQQAHRYPMA